VSAGAASPPMVRGAAGAHCIREGEAPVGQRASRIRSLIASMFSGAPVLGSLALAVALAAAPGCASTTRRDTASLDE
jgi:hypothetical protein